MNDLEQLRAELDGIDRELVRLFEERMKIARGVAAYKIANGLPVLDSGREERVLASREALVTDPALSGAVRELFTEIMRLSRAEQARLMAEEHRV